MHLTTRCSKDFNATNKKFKNEKEKVLLWNPIKQSWRFAAMMKAVQWKRSTKKLSNKQIGDMVRKGMNNLKWDDSIPGDPVVREQWDEFYDVHRDNMARITKGFIGTKSKAGEKAVCDVLKPR